MALGIERRDIAGLLRKNSKCLMTYSAHARMLGRLQLRGQNLRSAAAEDDAVAALSQGRINISQIVGRLEAWEKAQK